MTAQDVVDAFRDTYSDCDQTQALAILSDVYEEILQWIPLRLSRLALPLAIGVQEQDVAESVIRAWEVDLVKGKDSFASLAATSRGWLKEYRRSYRHESAGEPEVFFMGVDETGGTLGLVPTPSKASLAITAATNATPIVITTGAIPHGLATGDGVRIAGVLGNLAANGDWTVTVLSATTFSLDTSAGSGAYASGGYVASSGKWWYLEVSATTRQTLSLASVMPALPHLRSVYSDGMRAEWAKRRKRFDEMAAFRAEFERTLSLQEHASEQRADGVHESLNSFRQKKSYRGVGGLR